MNVPVSHAKSRLTDLVRRAEAGDDIVLTRRGEPKVRLVPVESDDLPERRRRALDKYGGCLKGKPGLEGVTAATISDFLYDERGLPA